MIRAGGHPTARSAKRSEESLTVPRAEAVWWEHAHARLRRLRPFLSAILHDVPVAKPPATPFRMTAGFLRRYTHELCRKRSIHAVGEGEGAAAFEEAEAGDGGEGLLDEAVVFLGLEGAGAIDEGAAGFQ